MNFIYRILLWIMMTVVRLGVAIIMVSQAAALLITAPFGSLFERTFIKVATQNSEIADTLAIELQKDEKARKRKKK